MRRAPASSTFGSRSASMPPMANQGLLHASSAVARTSASPGAGASGLGRGRPTRPDAEIVDVLGDRRGDLLTVVGGTADHRVRADDLARHAQRQVVLAQVQHGGAGGTGDVGAVIDGQQRAMPPRRVGEHLQRRQFVAGLERAQPALSGRALVAQLNDVDPAGQRCVGELGQIAALPTRIGAQIQASVGEPVRLVHTATLATTVGSRHGSPASGV